MLVIGRNNLSLDVIHLKSNHEKSDSIQITHTTQTVQLTGDSKDNIQQIYIDDSGHHVIITTHLNEVIYYNISKQQQVYITKFTDRIECVSFCGGNENESQSEVKSQFSVPSILLGTSTGAVCVLLIAYFISMFLDCILLFTVLYMLKVRYMSYSWTLPEAKRY